MGFFVKDFTKKANFTPYSPTSFRLSPPPPPLNEILCTPLAVCVHLVKLLSSWPEASELWDFFRKVPAPPPACALRSRSAIGDLDDDIGDFEAIDMGDFDAVEIGDFEECFEFCVSMSDWVRPIFGLGGDISCKNKKCFNVFEMLRCSN